MLVFRLMDGGEGRDRDLGEMFISNPCEKERGKGINKDGTTSRFALRDLCTKLNKNSIKNPKIGVRFLIEAKYNRCLCRSFTAANPLFLIHLSNGNAGVMNYSRFFGV